MPSRATLVIATTLLTAAAAAHAEAPPPAPAPVIAVDRGCYADPSVRGERVRMSGTGFTPGATYQVSLDSQPLPGGTGTVDAEGKVGGSLAAPSLAAVGRNTTMHQYRLRVQEGASQPETTFRVTTLRAAFSPDRGDPRTLFVRFRAFGLALGLDPGSLPRPVFVHYVTPGGRLKRSVRLGRTAGPCGTLRPTARKRLFPFVPSAGLWKLQFDTRQKYTRGTADAAFAYYTVGVRVS